MSCMIGKLKFFINLSLMIMLVSGFASAEQIVVETEAEFYQVYGFLNISSLPISILFVTNASNHRVVKGMDIPGEWIELQITFPEERCYASTLFGKVLAGLQTDWRVTMLGAGPGGEDLIAD